MLDKDNNPIRYYEVVYTRFLATNKRILLNGILTEWQLQQMLYDFTSRYLYIVESAKYLPDYEG